MIGRFMKWLRRTREPQAERAVLAETDRNLRDVPALLELYHRRLEALTGQRIVRMFSAPTIINKDKGSNSGKKGVSASD